MSGILGVYSDKQVSKELYYGIYSMQHRGQESCGIAIYDEEAKEVVYKKEKGLVGDAFKEDELKNYKGNLGIAHVRSSSVGHNHVANTQPFVGSCRNRNLAIVDNGSLVNANYLRETLEEEGFMFQTNSDAEVILHILARYYKGDIVEAVKVTMDYIKGSYTLAIICDDSLVAVRDPHGFRSLLLGKKGNEYLIASENSAIEILGGEVIRDVEPGEIIVIKDGELKSYSYSDTYKPVKKSCIFEHVYIARNDATLDDLNAYEFRINCGAYLAKNEDVKADCVVPVPDSGWASAIGYANESGLQLSEGLVKNRYVGRTFIKPTQEEREIAVRIKLNPLVPAIKGKSIILVDDSIVRGTTSKQLIKSLKEAGAKEVHLRITSPPVKYPCYYGIDTPTRESLLAATHSVEEMREYIGCDTLKFISIEGMKEAAKGMNTFCTSCFDGDYPVRKIDK